MKIGIIGYRNFAAKLSAQFKLSDLVSEIVYYHPTKKLEGLLYTNDFSEICDCEAIVIASPDFTHADYLRKLNNYQGYIFCEKIPVIKSEDIRYLDEWKNKQLYFNFMLRRSIVSELLTNSEDEIININITHGHGLGFKESYKDNWRNDCNKTPMGVFQVSGIHFFDLLVYLFDEPESILYSSRVISPYGKTIDNFSVSMEFKNKIIADLFFSYTSPCQNLFNITCKDKLYRINECGVAEYGPRDVFDSKGRFIPPPAMNKIGVDIFEDALEKSVSYFLDIVKDKKEFPESSLETNLLSTKMFLNIQKDPEKRSV